MPFTAWASRVSYRRKLASNLDCQTARRPRVGRDFLGLLPRESVGDEAGGGGLAEPSLDGLLCRQYWGTPR